MERSPLEKGHQKQLDNGSSITRLQTMDRRNELTKPAPAKKYFDFANVDNYTETGGFALPKGRYCMFFDFILHTPMDKQGTVKGDTKLALRASCYDPADPTIEPKEAIWGMGKKAHNMYLPDPDDPKRLVPVIGQDGKEATGQLDTRTNFFIFFKSMLDCQLPVDKMYDDEGFPTLANIDGIWMDTEQADEPESRKEMGKVQATGQVAPEPRKPMKITVCVNIPDEGKPWEGTGGMPEAAAPAKPKAPVKPAPKAPAKPTAPARPQPPAKRPAPPVAEPEPEPGDGEDQAELGTIALDIISDVLGIEGFQDKISTMKMQVEVIKAAKKKFKSDEMGTAIVAEYFSPEGGGDREAILNSIGYHTGKDNFITPIKK